MLKKNQKCIYLTIALTKRKKYVPLGGATNLPLNSKQSTEEGIEE